MTERLTETGDGLIFEVFARFRPDEPLRHIGSVVAQDSEAAKLHAFTLYNEWDWSRMIVAPRRDIVTLVDPAGRAAAGMEGPASAPVQIYGRKQHTEPLAFVLSTDQASLRKAPEASAGEWVELVAIPDSAMTVVLGEEAAP